MRYAALWIIIVIMVTANNYFDLGLSTRAQYIKNCSSLSGTEVSNEDLLTSVNSDMELILKELHVSANKLGYTYWKDAVFIFIMQDMKHANVCKDIYPVIGKKYNKSAMSIERAMRSSFESSFFFSEKQNEKNPVFIALRSVLLFPKNSELVVRIVELITTKEFQNYKRNLMLAFEK